MSPSARALELATTPAQASNATIAMTKAPADGRSRARVRPVRSPDFSDLGAMAMALPSLRRTVRMPNLGQDERKWRDEHGHGREGHPGWQTRPLRQEIDHGLVQAEAQDPDDLETGELGRIGDRSAEGHPSA